MGREGTKVIRLTDDAYNALVKLRKSLIEHGQKSYSYSDVIIAAALLLDNAIKRHASGAIDLANSAKELRLSKSRGELSKDVDIFEELRESFPECLDWFTTPINKVVVSIIEQLVDDGYADAAAGVLLTYKDKLLPEEFFKLSAKILEAQMQMKKQVKKQAKG